MKYFLISTIAFIFFSCEYYQDVKDLEDQVKTGLITTNDNGVVEINNEFLNRDIEITCEDENGNKLSNVNLEYQLIDSCIFISAYDDAGEYFPVLFMGNPLHKEQTITKSAGFKPQAVVITLTIAGAIKLAFVLYSGYQAFKAGWEMSDYVLNIRDFYIENQDNINVDLNKTVLETTPEDLVGVMMDGVGISKCVVNIGLSIYSAHDFVKLGRVAFSKAYALEVGKIAADFGREKLTDIIYEYLREEWGSDTESDMPITVVVYHLPAALKLTTGFAGFQTIVEIFPNAVIQDVPKDINYMINQNIIDKLVEMGMPINKGTSPNSFEGIYLCDDLRQLDTDRSFMNYNYSFTNYIDEFRITHTKESINKTDVGSGSGLVSGLNNNFSYFAESSSYSDESDHIVFIRRTDIFSGTITVEGIKDFHLGFVVTYKENDLNSRYMNIGDYRVIYEADGMASYSDELKSQILNAKNNTSLLLK